MQKSPRMEQIEALLQEDPSDPFLQYGLAMEHFSLGQDEPGIAVLEALMQSSQPPYVPAFLMAGQAYQRLGQLSDAARVLRAGMKAAQETGNSHAYGEMQNFLSLVE